MRNKLKDLRIFGLGQLIGDARILAVFLWCLLAALVVVGGIPSGIDHEVDCASDSLVLPPEIRALAPKQTALRSAGPRAGALLDLSTLAWRQIDTVLVLPTDFGVDPYSNAPLGKTREELRAEATTAVALANRYLRPLRLVINVVEIQDFSGANDPYAAAVSHRNPFEMLNTGIARADSYQTKNYDLVLVLARRYFQNGTYGLSYPAVSCLSQSYSVVFATAAGTDPAMTYSLGHTIAHEVGHYLGMEHDMEYYTDGVTLMAPRFSVYPTGFSEQSLTQALAHSGPGATGSSCFEASPYQTSADSDWDGVSDTQEAADGSNQLDAGSFKTTLASPVYSLWNSFLSMVNILELVNPTDESVLVTVTRHGLDGSVLNNVSFSIGPRKQFDLIVNGLPGFEQDSYGLLKISFVGKLDGRTSYYRLAADGVSHEFAFSIPLLNPNYDTTALAFNTSQPSLNPAQAADQVVNWLTLVNLSPNTKLFRVNSFNQVGGVLSSKTVTVAGFARADIDGGHGFAGPNVVGLHQIVPADPQAPYIAQLNRYGANAAQAYAASGYRFAFPLVAHAGTGVPVALPLHAGATEDTWLEISNTKSSNTTVSVQYLDAAGNSIYFEQMQLGAFQQFHVNAEAVLAKTGAVSGSAIVTADRPEALLAQSMRYFRNGSGTVTAMYGEQMDEPLGAALAGSYNLFLGMQNTLRLTNTLPVQVSTEVQVTSAAGTRSVTISLAPNSTQHIALAATRSLSLEANTYGLLSIRASTPDAVSASLLRSRTLNAGTPAERVDMAMPTALR